MSVWYGVRLTEDLPGVGAAGDVACVRNGKLIYFKKSSKWALGTSKEEVDRQLQIVQDRLKSEGVLEVYEWPTN